MAITPNLFDNTIAFLDFDHKKDAVLKSQFSMDEWLGIYPKIKKINKIYHSKDHHFLEIYVKELLVDLLMSLLQMQISKEQRIPLWLDKAYQKKQEQDNYLVGLSQFIEISTVSQEHLNRSMKKYFDITPTVFVNQLRLQYAAILLSSSEKPVIEIIFKSGFENVSHFSRLFKKYYHLTPSQYRSINKKIYNPN